MYSVKAKHLLCYFVAICTYRECTSLNIPTPTAFFSNLLNTTADQLVQIATNFTFVAVSPKNVHFLFYLPNNPNPIDLSNSDNLKLLDGSKETKFIIHGWTDNGSLDWVAAMAEAFHQAGACNVISVDWGKDAAQDYEHAATAVQSIGFLIGDFILDKLDYIKTKVHLIGHSLGAHIAGFAGKRIKAKMHQVLDRITGLDAAGPLFETTIYRPNLWKLAKGDAKFVDLIHTDMVFAGVVGCYGDADFYVNLGGPIQPECLTTPTVPLLDEPVLFLCSHRRSYIVFTESISAPEKFQAVSCPSSALFELNLCNNNDREFMGEGVSRAASGPYYLNTI